MVLWLLAISLALLAGQSCSDGSSTSQNSGGVSHDGTNMSIKMYAPPVIAALAITNLQAEAIIDENEPHSLTVDPLTNTISGTIPGVPVGMHDLQVRYFVSLSGNVVVLCTFSTQVDVVAGQSNPVTITDDDLIRNIDDDYDGYTNLAEVRSGTDPLSPYDFPGGGSPIVLAGGGIVQKTSSQSYTIRQIVGSAVAGNASSANYEVIVSYIGYE
jgi:hypothetical protein